MAKQNSTLEHEESDISIRALLIFAVGLIVSAVVIHIGLWLLFRYYYAREDRAEPVPTPLAKERPALPREPRLQVDPISDLRNIRSDERRALENYGWIDEKSGTVRLPIDRAIDITLQKGLPARTPATVETSVEMPADASSGRRVERRLR